MKETQRKLRLAFFIPIVIALLMVVVFETGWILPGAVDDRQIDFMVSMVMVLITLGVIPFALYMFRIPKIRHLLTHQPEQAAQRLLSLGLVRMSLLSVPMVLNILFYYLFCLNTSYFYMGVILFLSMFFIYPSIGRCQQEITPDS